MATLNQNISNLEGLLSPVIINSKRYSSHPIRRCIDLVLQHHFNNQPILRDYENCRLSLLVKNLKEIKTQNENLFNKFKRDILRANKDTYYGLRLEISVAASLIRSKISFYKSESPDFILDKPFKKASIECGSLHLTRTFSTNDDLNRKIESVIRQKAKKDYCHKASAIFIDVTNIHHFDAGKQNIIKIKQFE